jgi:hypothetical protein
MKYSEMTKMKQIDMRFDQNIIRSWIGAKFEKYRCDRLDYTNSVTQVVGLYISGEIFALKNEQELVDYFGKNDDIAVYRLLKLETDTVKSAFFDMEQIDTNVSGIIESVTIVNENQQLYENNELLYDVWITRGIIFQVDGIEILFEKDTVPFSEEIFIQRGYDLYGKIASSQDFLLGWDEEYESKVFRDAVVMRA